MAISGNVGIGPTSPNYKLEVNGSFAATGKSFDIPDPRYDNENKRLIYGSDGKFIVKTTE